MRRDNSAVMKSKLLGGTGLLLALVLLFVINIFSNASFTTARIDFTEDGLYTLSDGTLNILASLDEPITLRFYLSREAASELPGVSSYTARVEELLNEYEIRAAGNLRLLILDPEPFSEEEDRAVGLGVRGLGLADADETFYFGLVGSNTVGEQQVIPYFNQAREQFLEYDITRLVQQLSQTKRPVVGLLSTLPISGVNADTVKTGVAPQALTVIKQIRESFVLRNLELDLTAVDDDVDLLMIIHPHRFSAATLYAIDQFVMRGGRALVFVDPYAEADARPTQSGIPHVTESDFNRILSAWSLELEPKTVVADLQFATRVQTQQDGKVVVFDYPVWITYPAELLNPFDTVTADLDSVTFASVGHLRILDTPDVFADPLVKSTFEADRVSLEQIAFTADPQELLRNYEGENQQFPLLVRVTGRPSTAFPDGPPAKEDFFGSEAETEQPRAHEHINQAADSVNLIVVADSDFLQDRYWVQTQTFAGNQIALPFAGNGSLVINALDNLSGSDDLIAVRSRGSFSRPFDRVSAIRRDAELQFREQEQVLISRLEETEQELLALENQKQGEEAVILNEAQQQRLREFREQRVEVRRALRDVRHELRKDIETLEGWLKFINIGLVPLLIGISACLAATFKWRNRKSALAGQTRQAVSRAAA